MDLTRLMNAEQAMRTFVDEAKKKKREKIDPKKIIEEEYII